MKQEDGMKTVQDGNKLEIWRRRAEPILWFPELILRVISNVTPYCGTKPLTRQMVSEDSTNCGKLGQSVPT
ncbi:hypothetical protein J6590_098383 [Homalodisca vitripennis]|nr:hypothetical protein J6590_098383 [Homalodisca vitripennis]